MILVKDTTDTFSIITDAAADVEVHATFVDYNTSSGLYSPDRTNTASITTATTTVVVGSPGSNIRRALIGLFARNNHASQAVTVTPVHSDGTNAQAGPKCLLLAGETFVLGENGHWVHLNASGNQVVSGWTGILNPGTSATPPLLFQAGTNLSTPQAGAAEYDGGAFYLSPGASNRGVNTLKHFTSQNANWTGQNVNTAQPVFNTDRDVFTLPGNTSYFFEALYHILTTGTTSHQTGVLFGGTATLTSIAYMLLANQPGSETYSAGNIIWAAAATIIYPFAAVAAATYSTFLLKGIVRVNAGGTFIPQFQFSAAPGVAPTIAANSYFSLEPVGNGSVSFVGNIA